MAYHLYNNYNVLGFGGRMKSGKTTLASMLLNFKKVAFADWLKEKVCLSLEQPIADFLDPIKKEEVLIDPLRWTKRASSIFKEFLSEHEQIHIIPELEKLAPFTTRRSALQIIGTDVLRAFNKDFHVIKTIASLDNEKQYVFDDIRYPNELNALLSINAHVSYIIRPTLDNVSNHISETALTWASFKNILINDYEFYENANYSTKKLFFEDYQMLGSKNLENLKSNKFLADSTIDAYYAGMAIGGASTSQTTYWDNSVIRKCLTYNNPNVSKMLSKFLDINYEKGFLIIKNPFIIENLKRWM